MLFNVSDNSDTQKFAVLGLGLFGRKLAVELADLGHDVVAVDEDEEAVAEVRDEVTKAVIGDASSKSLLDELITDDFSAVVVTMGTNLESSLLCVLHAREIGVESVIAKSKGDDHTTILKRIGVDRIIMPEEDVASQLAETIGKPKVIDYLQLEDDYSIMECVVPEEFVGQSLVDLNLREEHGVQVIGIRSGDNDDVDFVPSPHVPFEDGDIIWLMGPDDVLSSLTE